MRPQPDASPDVKRLNPGVYGMSVATSEAMKPGEVLVTDGTAKNSVLLKNVGTRKSIEDTLNKTEKRWLEANRVRSPRPFAITLRLANGVKYTPDFYIEPINTRIDTPIFYEIKGAYVRPDAWTKLKMAASLFPEFCFIMAQWKEKRWTETEIKP